jgi:hypothetical protein
MNTQREIFLLIGQSNMAGRGLLDTTTPLTHPNISMFRDGQWQMAKEPLHTDKTTAGISLGISFAYHLFTQAPNKQIGLLPCAVGGTPLSRWMPQNDLYENAVSIAKTALSNGNILKGILWHQGEADSKDIPTANTYGTRLTTMISTLRIELQADHVPFISGELGHFLQNHEQCTYFTQINYTLRTLKLPHYTCVSAHGLTDIGDNVHFDGPSLREFGQRYAIQYLKMSHH